MRIYNKAKLINLLVLCLELCALSLSSLNCWIKTSKVKSDTAPVGFASSVANFTLDWDGKILILLENGEYLVKLDTSLLPQETIPLPSRVFAPKKVLANFSYLFISNTNRLFILARREGNWEKVFSLGEIKDFTLSPSGEVFLLIKDERQLKMVDRFFNLRDFPSSPIDPSAQTLANLKGDLYLLNPKGEITLYSRLGQKKKTLSFPQIGGENFFFSPHYEGEEIYLFSKKGKVFSLVGEELKTIGEFGEILSCFPYASSLFLLFPDKGVKRIPR